MWHLYVLKSQKSGRKYIGISDDPKTRLVKHNSGSVRSTKAYRPWVIIYDEIFNTKREARIEELSLKKNGFKRAKLFGKINDGALSSIG